MITLYKNINGSEQLVDFGTKPDVALYVKQGYTVKVLNSAETVDLRNKLKFAKLWKTVPKGLKDKVREMIHDDELNWAERLELLKVEIINSRKRAQRIKVVHRPVVKEWTITEQLQGVVNDIKSALNWLFVRPTLAQLQLARA